MLDRPRPRDTLHVGDLLPSRPGLECSWFTRTEPCRVRRARRIHLRNHRESTATSADPTNGVADDIFPNIQVQRCGARGTRLSCRLRTVPLSAPSPTRPNFLVYWDADESRELEDGTAITKYGGGTLLNCASVRRTTAAKPPRR